MPFYSFLSLINPTDGKEARTGHIAVILERKNKIVKGYKRNMVVVKEIKWWKER